MCLPASRLGSAAGFLEEQQQPGNPQLKKNRDFRDGPGLNGAKEEWAQRLHSQPAVRLHPGTVGLASTPAACWRQARFPPRLRSGLICCRRIPTSQHRTYSKLGSSGSGLVERAEGRALIEAAIGTTETTAIFPADIQASASSKIKDLGFTASAWEKTKIQRDSGR